MLDRFKEQLSKEKEMAEDVVLLDSYISDVEFFETLVPMDTLEMRSKMLASGEPEEYVPSFL